MGGSFLRRRAERRLAELQQKGDQELRETAAESNQETTKQESTKQARPRQGAGGWRSIVEQRIQDGMERGLFDNLSGAGKPLNLEEDALVPEDMRMAFRLLRSNGLAPLWVELNKEIRDDIERLARFRAHVQERVARTNAIQWEHRRNEYIRRVEDINSKIVNYNILAPSVQVHFDALIMADELRKFDEL